jgi:hypothetical protein
MSEQRFQGLNLPQLMELMHPNVVPEPIPWTPQTIGWAIAAAWLVATVLIAALAWLRAWRANRYRREALAALTTVGSGHELAVLVRRAALAAYPRAQVAHLCGSDWAEFLSLSSGRDPIVAAAAEQLAQAAYRADVNLEQVKPAARRWIQVHRA